jgi:hypothetical protein
MLLTLLPFAPAAAPPRGGLTELQAISQFKAAIAVELQSLRSQLQISKKIFFALIAEYEFSVNFGLDVETQTSWFYLDCSDFQLGVQDAANAASQAIASAGAAALSGLANGTPLQGVYPKDFYSGGGGALDKALRDVKANVVKLYKPIANRLRKTVTVLEKKGAALTVEIRPPVILEDCRILEGVSTFDSDRLGLDIIVAVNRSEIAEDGRVWLAGSAYPGLSDIDVLISGPELDTGVSTAPDGRWSVSLTDAGTFFVKGNYVAHVRAGTDDVAAGGRFSFR